MLSRNDDDAMLGVCVWVCVVAERGKVDYYYDYAQYSGPVGLQVSTRVLERAGQGSQMS